MRFAVTADLHWGINAAGDAATRQMIAYLTATPPEVLILAGDVGAGADFERCLEQFEQLNCRKALVPGNHDIWVSQPDERGDSWQVYHSVLPALCARHGFHYLDQAPLLLPEIDAAVVGTINWYDYSWSSDRLPDFASDWEERLRNKRFLRGRHNDGRFVRWQHSDVSFTALAVATLERHLTEALAHVGKVVLVTHHPAFEGLNFPVTLPPHLDQLLWKAFSGNRALVKVIERYAEHIAVIFSGHTHKECHNDVFGIPGYNIGGDYGWKRLLEFCWPKLEMRATPFTGDAAGTSD